MKLTGLRRGLATSAVSALAITGLAVTPAPARAADGPVVRLVSQLGKVIATRPDGSFFDDEVRIVVERPEDWGLQLEVNPDPRAAHDDPDWTGFGTQERIADPYISTSWSPSTDAPELVGTRVAFRARASDGVTTTAWTTLRDVLITPPNAETHAVHTEDFSAGYFVQPYASAGRTASLVGIAGTTSATDGAVTLEEWRPTAGAYRRLTSAAINPTDVKGYRGDEIFTVAGGEFDAVLSVSAFDAEQGDGVAIRATRGTEDVFAGTVHEQTIDRIDYQDEVTTSAGTTVDLKVTADGEAVAGAEVRRDDQTLVGYTNGAGIVTVTQPAETTRTYYVNTGDGDAYDAAVDFAVEYTSPAFTRAATALRPVLAGGAAFADREYAPGDIALQVVDQDGKPFAGAREVEYRLYPDGAAPPALTTATTDANGRIVVPYHPAGPDGLWRFEHAIAEVYPVYRWDRFVAGRAAVTLSPRRGRATSGGTLTYTGRVTVAGTPLARRAVTLAFRRGKEQAPGTRADAGILAAGGRKLTARTSTRADGTFTVRVGDRREKGAPSEKGGELLATAPALGAAAATATVQFGNRTRTPRLELRGTDNGAAADRLVVVAPVASAGERVRVLAKVGRRWKAVRTARLDRRGHLSLRVEDRNGAGATSYVARLLGRGGAESAVTRVR